MVAHALVIFADLLMLLTIARQRLLDERLYRPESWDHLRFDETSPNHVAFRVSCLLMAESEVTSLRVRNSWGLRFAFYTGK